MTELQKDPMTRGDFLSLGLMGTIMGAILTIPPVAFVLGPVIKTKVLGQSNVADTWVEVGPVSAVPVGKPKYFPVEFPITQSYGDKKIQKESNVGHGEKFTVRNAVWLSWKAPILEQGKQGSGGDKLGKPKRPAVLDKKKEGFSAQERQGLLKDLNILSNSCAHLGCPVRWRQEQELFLCPCHGGLYDLNGGWVGGPPPRGLYHYTEAEIRENGKLYIKHKYNIQKGLNMQEPYVV